MALTENIRSSESMNKIQRRKDITDHTICVVTMMLPQVLIEHTYSALLHKIEKKCKK